MTSKSTNAFGDLLAPASQADKSQASQAHAGEAGRGPEPEAHSTGILPSQELEHLIRVSKDIAALEPIRDDQIQPASLDLRLGSVAYRVRASFLPGKNSTVQEKLELFAMHKIGYRERRSAGARLRLHRSADGERGAAQAHVGDGRRCMRPGVADWSWIPRISTFWPHGKRFEFRRHMPRR